VSLRQSYSREFKEAIVAKLMNRGNQTIEEICEREGVGKSTAVNWLRARVNVANMAKQKTAKKWTPEEKLKAIIETSTMSEEELGAFLRRGGLHSHQLREWREEVLKGLQSAPRKSQSKKDERDEKIKSLEHELRRKDKALAEASALLILQKKIDLIWGSKSEDEK
jgi:transposase-like protein